MPWTCSWGHFIYSFSYFLIFEIGSGCLCILGWHEACDRFTSASPGLSLQRCTTTLTHGNNFIILSGRGSHISPEAWFHLLGFPMFQISAESSPGLPAHKGELVVSLKYIPASKLPVGGDRKKSEFSLGPWIQLLLASIYRAYERPMLALLARAGWDVSWIF